MKDFKIKTYDLFGNLIFSDNSFETNYSADSDR